MIPLNLYGCHFEYAGVSSRKYGLIFANVETSRLTSISGETESVTFFSKRNKRNYFLEESFEDSPLTFEAEVVSETDQTFDPRICREIEKWLFHRKDYSKLYVDAMDDWVSESTEVINGERKRLYLNCRFVNASKLEYLGGVIGYRFTVECDSNMAWQEPIEKTYTIDNSAGATVTTELVVTVDTDIVDYVYPKVTITTASASASGEADSIGITIINQTDDSARLTSFTGLPVNTQIVMNGSTNYIDSRYYPKFSGMNFIRLLDGDNKISVQGDVASIKFEWQNRRYLT